MPRNKQIGFAGYTEAARWIVLIGLMLGAILEVLDVSIVNVAIPDMMGSLGATLDQINWVSTGYIIANVIILPLTGWLSARFGRRLYLTGSILLFTAASLFCGLSSNLNTLIFFRVLQGAGGAALLSTSMATLLEIFPPQQQGLVAGIFGIGVMVGPTIGPKLGGFITDNYSWPWIFFINIPVGILAASLTMLYLHDSDHQEVTSAKADWIGIILLAIGVGCLQVVLERGNRENWMESSMIRWLSSISFVGMLSFIWWELKIDNPAVNLRVLKNRGLSAGTVYSAVVGFAMYGSLFILPIFLQQVRGYTADQTGQMMMIDGAAAVISMALVSKLVDRLSSRILVGLGSLFFAYAMFLLGKVTLNTGPEHLYLPLILRGTSLGLLFVPLSLASLSGLKGKEMADGSGLFNLTRQWGGSLGIAFLSTMLDHRTEMHRAFLAEHITAYSPIVQYFYHKLSAYFVLQGSALATAKMQAFAAMDTILQGQAAVLAFEDAFLCISIAFIITLPLIFLMQKGRAVSDKAIVTH